MMAALVAAAGRDVAVDGVVAGVERAAREPAIERRVAVVEHAVPGLSQCSAFAASAQNAAGLSRDRP